MPILQWYGKLRDMYGEKHAKRVQRKVLRHLKKPIDLKKGSKLGVARRSYNKTIRRHLMKLMDIHIVKEEEALKEAA